MLESRILQAGPLGAPRELDESTRRLLEQPMRRRILGFIKEEPGIKISDLCRRTMAGWGTVKYHLHLLRKANLIVARPTGRDCLLFSSDYPVEELAVTEALRRGRAERLAQAIAETPGASQKELCERIHMTRKIIRRYVGLLSAAGLISERREAQFQRYYPGPRLAAHLQTGPNGQSSVQPAPNPIMVSPAPPSDGGPTA